MSKALKIIIIIILIGAIAGAGWWLSSERNNESENTTEQTQQSDSTSEKEASVQPDEEAQPAAATITYSDNGFSVSGQSVKVGQNIRVVNDSSQTLDFASNEHPTHTDNHEFNLGNIPPGDELVFSVFEPGEWGFHNHLRDSHSGSITVTE